MTEIALDHILDCQRALIAALDERDISAIEHNSNQLAKATQQLQNHDTWLANADTRGKIEHGLKQLNAARTRANILSDWTRQRIDRLNELRGISSTHIYTNS